jgi:RNA polymerase sigma-70 factor, ECF subfamily
METFVNSPCDGTVSTDAVPSPSAAVIGDTRYNDDPDGFLIGCRQYLLMIASEAIGPELRAKVGPSDLVQETFLAAHRDRAAFRGKTRAQMRAWLREMLECRLANVRRDYLVREKRAVRREVTFPDYHNEERRPGIASLTCPAPSPSNHAIGNELKVMLQQAIIRLPERSRQVVVWRQMEQLSWDEIGETMGCTADAARKVWVRALRQLRIELVDHETMA